MARRSALRASDLDRDRVADQLRHAAAEGRIRTEELEDRLEATFSARTYGQLQGVTSDLPVGPQESHFAPLWVRATLGAAGAVGVLAAAAAAMLLFLTIAGASVAWIVLERAIAGGRARRLAHGADPPRLPR